MNAADLNLDELAGAVREDLAAIDPRTLPADAREALGRVEVLALGAQTFYRSGELHAARERALRAATLALVALHQINAEIEGGAR